MTTHTHRCQHFENGRKCTALATYRFLVNGAPATLRRADANGTIRVIRTPGGRRRVPMSEVQRYLSQRTPDQQEAA